MANSKILKGTAILGIAGIFVKILGAVFRIPLTALIGTEGMAYYGYAYPPILIISRNSHCRYSCRHIENGIGKDSV